MAKHLRIVGIVQGVGYRASFETRARALRLAGWVRNRRDGSVEAVVSGDAQAIEAIVEWARRGPPAARVDQVTVGDIDDASITPGVFRTVATQ
jgi:acylphosphatase